MTFDDEARRVATATRVETDRLPIPELDALRPMRRPPVRTAFVAAACIVVVALVATAFAITGSRGSNGTKHVKTIESPGTWVKIPFGATGLEPGAAIAAVVQHGTDLVAVGSVTDPTRPVPVAPFETGAAWISADGRRWQRVPLPPDLPSLAFVVTTPRGLLAVTGQSSDADHAIVLHSDDGHRLDVVTTAGPPNVGAVTAGGPGIVATGLDTSSSPPRTAIWSSPDGHTWMRAPGDASVFPPGSITGVAAREHALVAVGFQYRPSAAVRATPLVWTSSDGAHWELHRDPFHGGFPESIAASDDEFLLGGIRLEPSTTTTTHPPATAPSQIRCYSSVESMVFATANGSITTWTSRDGRDWTSGTRATGPVKGTRPLFAAHGAWIAGGSTDMTSDGFGAAAWVSSDGTTWGTGFTEAPTTSSCGPRSRTINAATATLTGALLVVGAFGVSGPGAPLPGPDIWLWTAPSSGGK